MPIPPRAFRVGLGACRVTLLCLVAQALLACSAVPPSARASAMPRAVPAADDAHDAAELGKQLANPIAALISVPFQFNYDHDIGPGDGGDRTFVNIQPVIPIELNEDWNIISRTILPLTTQHDIVPGAGGQFGFGDVTQSVFFSPKAPSESGWIWGVGPVFLLPTGTDDLLSSQKWGAGPTGVALKQEGPWTYGALANHIWSFAGDDDRADVNSTFLQPFLSYTTPTAWTYSLNSESTYDWEDNLWTVPFNVLATKVTRIGDQLVSVGGGLRYWAHDTTASPDGIGLRMQLTLLYPKQRERPAGPGGS